MTRLALLALGALLIAVPAGAAPSGSPSASAPAASASAAAPSSSLGMEGEEDDSAIAKDEKPEGRTKRRNYIRRMKKELNQAVHANGKSLTDAERAVIRAHWHVSMRLWRIRSLADADANTAAVAQVDALLPKEDAKTLAELTALNAKAPALGAATTGAK